MITATRTTVSTTPVLISPATPDHKSGARLLVKNTHATDALVLGPSTVTAGNGFSLAAGATLDLELADGELLYAVRGGAADITAHVLAMG